MRSIIKNLSNAVGWRTKRKIIVFESDDWGTVRMPSTETFDRLKKLKVPMSADTLRYNTYDNLANSNDLKHLFEVLETFKDSMGSHPMFTAISIMANPDFKRIRDSDFEQYFFEPFPDTLKKYGFLDAFEWWKIGMHKNIFVPQFHAREHLNVPVWMRALRKKDKNTHEAFNMECWSFDNCHSYGISYVASFDLDSKDDLLYYTSAISEGLLLFEQLFGYKADFFVPPNGPLNRCLEVIAGQCGIKYISTSKMQREPLGQGKTRLRLHYLGQKNKIQQKYITRNCFFEPNIQGTDSVEQCIRDISLAFRWDKPAVISTHRLNYISSLNPGNGVFGLEMLTRLLGEVVQKWPDVEFMSSSKLGALISNNKDVYR